MLYCEFAIPLRASPAPWGLSRLSSDPASFCPCDALSLEAFLLPLRLPFLDTDLCRANLPDSSVAILRDSISCEFNCFICLLVQI